MRWPGNPFNHAHDLNNQILNNSHTSEAETHQEDKTTEEKTRRQARGEGREKDKHNVRDRTKDRQLAATTTEIM
jgi:hypothetical protein